MIRTGIFIDGENVRLNGGFGLRYDVLLRYAESSNGVVLRANSYLVEDPDRMKDDIRYRERLFRFYDNLRRFGFKIIRKQAKKYVDDEGNIHRKANSDLDLAIDALLQSANLDRIILLTGDGDFIRLVVALQNRGCRVEVIGFSSVSMELSRTADFFVSGYLVPGLLRLDDRNITRGHPVHTYEFWESNGYGFIRYYELGDRGLRERRVFVHRSDLEEDYPIDVISDPSTILEFNVVKSTEKPGQFKAEYVRVWKEGVVV